MPTVELKDKIDGPLGQIKDVRRNKGFGRMHGVRKIDAEASSQERRNGNLEGGGLVEG